MSTSPAVRTASGNPDAAPVTGYPRKRRQTRRRLLRAGMAVLVERGPAQVTAGQIASAAGVAGGTFYNHFPSVDDFVDAVAEDLSRGVEIGRDMLNEIEHDPGRRVAIGVLQLLEMADTDPTAASAFVTLAALRPDFRARIRAIVGEAISDGVEARLFDVAVGPAAVNAVLGTALQSMRSRVLGEMDADDAPRSPDWSCACSGSPALTSMPSSFRHRPASSPADRSTSGSGQLRMREPVGSNGASVSRLAERITPTTSICHGPSLAAISAGTYPIATDI